MNIELIPINTENYEACAELQLEPQQVAFLPSPSECISELKYWPKTKGYALILDGKPVGIASFGVDSLGECKIFRFFIDQRFQGRGLGSKALDQALQKMTDLYPGKSISLCYHPRNEVAKRLYRRFGFTEIEVQHCSRNPEGKILAKRFSNNALSNPP